MDFYKILELEPTADAYEVRRAFRKQAMRYHPDLNTEADASQRFQLAYIAYDVLSDPDKRRRYDERLTAGIPFAEPTYTYYPPHRDPYFRRQWQQQAEAQASQYADMDFQEFEETVLDKIGRHSSQGLVLLSFIFMSLAGIMVTAMGMQLTMVQSFTGALFLGYILLIFGIGLVWQGIQAARALFNHWRTWR